MKGPKETTSDSRCGSRCVSSNDNLHAGWDPVGFHAISSRWKTKNRLSYDVRNFIFVSHIYFANAKFWVTYLHNMNQIDGLDSLSTQILPRCSVQTFRISMYKRWTTTLKTIQIFIDHSLIKQNPVANPCIICISHKQLRLPQPFISTITIILYSQGAANWAPKWPWSCLQWSLSQPVGLQPYNPWQAPHLPHRVKRGTWRCICFRAEVTGAAGHIVLWRLEVRWKREGVDSF